MVERTTNEISLDAMLEFVDFSTLEERFDETNTITEEFLNRDNVWCRARFVISKCNYDGKIEQILWLTESIDEEKRKRDELSATARNLNYQVSSISNIYMVVYDVDLIADSFSIIKSMNKIVNDLVGDRRTDAQFTIRIVMDAITDDSSLEEVMRFINFSTLENRLGNTGTVALEFLTKTKKWIRIRFLVSQRTSAGRLSHVLWLAEDIDAEKKDRDALIDMSERALAASEAKSSFLSNMSHEIRTPINAVLGMNEMILRECEDKNILAYSNSIRTAGSTLLGLVNDILDFSKIEAGKMEIIPVDYDLSSVINDLVNMIQSKADDKGLRLELDINRHIPNLLHGDEVRIKQIITNILTNAVKYTEKGFVKFCIDYRRIPDEPQEVILDISVVDTGIGIKKQDMNKLFSEFDRIEEERNRKVEGTGLGMSITKRLLEMMDSSLVVESIYGMGSKFSFELRQTVLKWDELGDYEAAYRASLGMRKKYREKFRAPGAEVLVVDDTPMNLVVFRSLLKQTGIKIDTANSGDEGLKMSYDKKYDIIFLDHMMPEKDGIETLHELRSRPKDPNIHTPTICLTANAISGAREQYLAEGFDDYLTKPIDSEKLESLLLDYLPEEKIEDAE
ncbi:MAG: response regulator [Ruminiclostridium sp.]|nr:response regulator [Ruminiclostridium sp.]